MELIYAYTRQQAIEDGVLVDVSETAKEAGFRCPIAVTEAVWLRYIEPSDFAREQGGQSKEGRLWDTLWMLLNSIRSSRSTGAELRYLVNYQMESKGTLINQVVQLKVLCHGGDFGEMVMTIMLPEED